MQLPGLRYYSPELGRWPSRDPIGEDGGDNLYAFVLNHCISLYDALGLESTDDCKITVVLRDAGSKKRTLNVQLTYTIEGPACCKKNAELVNYLWWTCTWGVTKDDWWGTSPDDPGITIEPTGKPAEGDVDVPRNYKPPYEYPGNRKWGGQPYQQAIAVAGAIDIKLSCCGTEEERIVEAGNGLAFSWKSFTDPDEDPQVKETK